jgi:hypothetical protein
MRESVFAILLQGDDQACQISIHCRQQHLLRRLPVIKLKTNTVGGKRLCVTTAWAYDRYLYSSLNRPHISFSLVMHHHRHHRAVNMIDHRIPMIDGTKITSKQNI